MKSIQLAFSQSSQCSTGCWCNSVEYAQQRIALPVDDVISKTITSNQFGIVEVVTCVHAYAGRQAPTHRDFLVFI